MSSSTYLKRLRPFTKTVTVSKTRPSDTTAYAIGDSISESTSVGTVWTFAGLAKAVGLGGILQSAMLIQSAAQTTRLSADLYLFDTSPTAANDNAVWNPSTAELKTCVAVLSFSGALFAPAQSNGVNQLDGIARSFQCSSSSMDLYGILIARNSYTPVTSEELTIRLTAIQD